MAAQNDVDGRSDLEIDKESFPVAAAVGHGVDDVTQAARDRLQKAYYGAFAALRLTPVSHASVKIGA